MFLASACSCLCDAPTTSEWSTIYLPTKVRLILETWRYHIQTRLHFDHVTFIFSILMPFYLWNGTGKIWCGRYPFSYMTASSSLSGALILPVKLLSSVWLFLYHLRSICILLHHCCCTAAIFMGCIATWVVVYIIEKRIHEIKYPWSGFEAHFRNSSEKEMSMCTILGKRIAWNGIADRILGIY